MYIYFFFKSSLMFFRESKFTAEGLAAKFNTELWQKYGLFWGMKIYYGKKRKGGFIFYSWIILPLACQDILVLVETLVLLVLLQLMNRDFPEQKNLSTHPHPYVHQNHREGIAELKCSWFPLHCQHGLDTYIHPLLTHLHTSRSAMYPSSGKKKIEKKITVIQKLLTPFQGREADWGKDGGYIHINNESFNSHCFLCVELQSWLLSKKQPGHDHAVGPGKNTGQGGC